METLDDVFDTMFIESGLECMGTEGCTAFLSIPSTQPASNTMSLFPCSETGSAKV